MFDPASALVPGAAAAAGSPYRPDVALSGLGVGTAVVGGLVGVAIIGFVLLLASQRSGE